MIKIENFTIENIIRFMREEQMYTLMISFFVIAFFCFTTSQIIDFVRYFTRPKAIHLVLTGPPNSGKTHFLNSLSTPFDSLKSMEESKIKLNSLKILGVRNTEFTVADVPSDPALYFASLDKEMKTATHVAFLCSETDRVTMDMLNNVCTALYESQKEVKFFIVGLDANLVLETAMKEVEVIRELHHVQCCTISELLSLLV